MSPKKHKLSLSIEEDYCLLGIVSDEPDYKLCWLINEKLKVTFSKTEDLLLFNRKLNEQQSFSVFQYVDESTMINYRMIRNRPGSDYFLTELKNIDYLLHMQGDLKPEEIKDIISKLLTVESVRMCVPVDLTKIKDKGRLLLW